MARYYETPDVDREREPPLQGVCKDCGNGTLNNDLHPVFEETDNGVVCILCHSTHVDVLRF
jgi:Zn finger protein HypA/HybF involved in hydrogenase expression